MNATKAPSPTRPPSVAPTMTPTLEDDLELEGLGLPTISPAFPGWYLQISTKQTSKISVTWPQQNQRTKKKIASFTMTLFSDLERTNFRPSILPSFTLMSITQLSRIEKSYDVHNVHTYVNCKELAPTSPGGISPLKLLFCTDLFQKTTSSYCQRSVVSSTEGIPSLTCASSTKY